MKTRLGIIFGGRSGEHEISIRSAKTVIEQIDKDKYEVVPIFIAPDGYWLGPSASLKRLPEPIGSQLADGTSRLDHFGFALIIQPTRSAFFTIELARTIQDGL